MTVKPADWGIFVFERGLEEDPKEDVDESPDDED